MTHDMVKYEITDAAIAKMADQFMGIVVTSPQDAENFNIAHNARIVVKGKRVEVEKKRKELKADALEYGRAVDTEAKRITALLTPIEEHLIAQEKVVTDEQERIRREAEEVEMARGEAEEKAKRDAEEARIRAEREAEQKKLDEERARLQAERAEMEAKMRVEQERMAAIFAEQQAECERLAKIEAAQRAEAARIEAEKKRIEEAEATERRTEAMRKALAESASLAKAEAEARFRREAEEAKNREVAEKVRIEAEQKAAEAMRPDKEKIAQLGITLLDVNMPFVSTPKAIEFVHVMSMSLGKLAKTCVDFGNNKKRGG